MANKKLGILFLVAVLLSFALGYISTQVIPGIPFRSQDVYNRIVEDFRSSYYYDITETDENQAYIASIRATINTFAEINNDPYTRLEAVPLDFNPSSNDQAVGLGIYYQFEDNHLRVLDVIYGGSVYGLLFPNDVIIGLIDQGDPLYFNDFDDQNLVLAALRGQLGDEKTLIVRNPDQQTFYVTFTYQVISTPAVTSKQIATDIAYIKINAFNPAIEGQTLGTATQFNNILSQLESNILNQNPESKTLIIDLRDNPGGSLSALHNQNQTGIPPGILQQLIIRDASNPIFEMVPKEGRVRTFLGGLSQSQQKAYTIKVLVNEQSASASEVMAAALHTHLDAEIYGRPTFGKKFYQDVVHLFDIQNVRYNLIYTTGIWTYGNGKNIVDDPLPVQIIARHPILNHQKPIYDGVVAFDQVDPSLILFQHFLNAYFGFQDDDLLRTDGYFDLSTELAFRSLQLERGLLETGTLNDETAKWISLYYMEIQHHEDFDIELLALIDVINNG